MKYTEVKGTGLLARYSIKLTNEFCQKMENADVLRIIATRSKKEGNIFYERERMKKSFCFTYDAYFEILKSIYVSQKLKLCEN